MSALPFDQRDGVIWMDGQMCAWKEAKLHLLSHGLHYGSGVFEGERVYGGKIFKLREHSERLCSSARILGFEIPVSVEALEDICKKVIEANNISEGYVRPIAWRGSEMMAVSAQKTTIHLAVACWEWGHYFSDKMRGIRLGWADFRRPAPDTAPVHSKATGLYMICTLSKHKVEAEGYDDALMLDYRGHLAEATGANLFLAIDGKLHTPTADCFLNGITRRTVIEIARQQGVETVERHIPPEDLGKASEVFLTGTAAEITPVREVGDISFNPGRLTENLLKAYDQIVRA